MFPLLAALVLLAGASETLARCRSQPGDSTYPSAAEWKALNRTIGGRLLTVVPSAKACQALQCTEEQWTSSVFRNTIPGQTNQYNWEQDYEAVPPELCLRNGTSCAQGDVPLYAVNATSAEHVQAGISFAAKFDLRVAVKSSGHDYLGRSTAKNSLLIWVHYLQNISFTENFVVNGEKLGSAVTAGSGVNLQTIYAASAQVGKMVVGGTAATVALGGGYIQGAGHSAFSPIFGLAADNALQFEVVLANGKLVTVNNHSYPDLFWALRGGGAGTWGVVTSVTVRTYPTFNTTEYDLILALPSVSLVGPVMSAHAQHVFDWGLVGHYYEMGTLQGTTILASSTFFPNTTAEEAIALMAPFFTAAQELGAIVYSNTTTTSIANERVYSADDQVAGLEVLGSRLIPLAAYANASAIGNVHAQLVENGYYISGNLIGGGKVSDNANISSAVLPKWRTSKGEIVAVAVWNESTTPDEVEKIRQSMTNFAVPLIANATGEANSGAYGNEADLREPDYQVTFYGDNYARLSEIKSRYDPKDLFIVGAGVGSERWDSSGLCTVYSRV